jgi:DNA-binding NtrC family response regulator
MKEGSPRILIIDNEPSGCDLLASGLSASGYDCTVIDRPDALPDLNENHFAAVFLDTGTTYGLELLKILTAEHPDTVCIVISTATDLSTAVENMKMGAADYITKPFQIEKVLESLETALKNVQSQREDSALPQIEPAVNDIEAIALGVEAQQEIIDEHSETVVKQTIQLARQMGFSEDHIRRWELYRNEMRIQRVKQLTTSICKFKG